MVLCFVKRLLKVGYNVLNILNSDRKANKLREYARITEMIYDEICRLGEHRA